jgi:hypothetical protein
LVAGLFKVPASGGTPSVLTTLDAARGEIAHRWPQVLPGGGFLYWAQSGKSENSGIYAARLTKPAERVRLLISDDNALYAPGGDEAAYLLWLREGTLVAQAFDTGTLKLLGEPYVVADPISRTGSNGRMNVAVSATGLLLYSDSNTFSQFTWFDRAGKPLGVVGESADNGPSRLSPDGRLVAVSRDRPGGSELWLLEVERGISKRFTNSGSNLYPVWSPDGQTIVYTSGNSRNLFRKESSGAASEQRLTQSPNYQLATDWSRDGRVVLYHESRPATLRDLWILPVTPDGRPATDGQPRPYLGTPSNESWGRFSPEASPRWVAYQSDESGRYEVYIQAFPERRGARQISTGGGQYPQWGAGGLELFYVSPDFKLMTVSLKLGADSVQPSPPRELFPLPATEIGGSPYDATPDGQRFLVSAIPPRTSLTVIVNWPAMLKKRPETQ